MSEGVKKIVLVGEEPSMEKLTAELEDAALAYCEASMEQERLVHQQNDMRLETTRIEAALVQADARVADALAALKRAAIIGVPQEQQQPSDTGAAPVPQAHQGGRE